MYVEEPPAPDTTSRQIIKSGEQLWFYDPQTGEMAACSLQYNVYGNRVVRCGTRADSAYSGSYPAYSDSYPAAMR